MMPRSLLGAAALAAALTMTVGGARAFDDAQYPNLKGQWMRVRPPAGVVGQAPFDPDKSWGLPQRAPLTSEYQARLEASLADQAAGGQGSWEGARCIPMGMPAIMTLPQQMEIIVFPEITYIRVDHNRDTRRRIYTDGRDWPANAQPGFDGYSIGRWLDTTGNGRFDTLEAETRIFKGPRSYDASGLPLHPDNQTVIRERIFLDQANPNLLHDEIVTYDHALTRPWVVMKTYRRVAAKEPIWWREDICAENNVHVGIGNEVYYLGADNVLMPAKKDQPPPDLRYFKKSQK